MSFTVSFCSLYEVPGRVAAEGVTHVLSLTEEREEIGRFALPALGGPHRRIGFADLGIDGHMEADDIAAARAKGLTVPTHEHVTAVLEFGRALMCEREPVHLLVHCHAGASRSPAAALLLMAMRDGPGREPASVAALHEAARGYEIIPNRFLIGWGDRLMGRQGRILAALRAHRRPPRTSDDHALF